MDRGHGDNHQPKRGGENIGSFSATEQALIRALVAAIVREIKAESRTEAA